MGVIFAVLNSIGISDELRDLLNILDNKKKISSEATFNNLGCIPSTPVDLEQSIDCSSFKTYFNRYF